MLLATNGPAYRENTLTTADYTNKFRNKLSHLFCKLDRFILV
jgi:hypothetical protein